MVNAKYIFDSLSSYCRNTILIKIIIIIIIIIR